MKRIGIPRPSAIQRAIWIVPLLLGCCASLSYGQVGAVDASLSGTVTDASGGLVANAAVRLSNSGRGLDFKTTTSSDGRYTFALVPPDAGYELAVEASGFSSYRQVGLTLTVGQSTELNVQLQVGKASAIVEVSGDTPLLNTQDANIGSEVNERAIVELPLSTRNLLSLLSLDSSVQPGVNLQQVPGLGSLADQDISFLSFGGQRFGTTAYLVDGMYDTGGDWGGVIYTPSVEETSEFRVQSNSYSAQYGWSTGNVVSMVTKSGTRDLHGDLWEFLRNEDLEGNSFFNNLNGIPRQKDRQNQFGGTIGGPVYIPGLYRQRDKTFFFFSLERIERTSPYGITTTMPLDTWKQGNFSGMLGGQIGTDAEGRPILANEIYNPFSTRQVTGGQRDPVTGLMVNPAACSGTCYIRDPFPGNIIPTNLFDPVARNLLKYWPTAQNQALTTNNFAFGGSETAHTQPLDVRIDHSINDRMRLFGKFAYKWVNFNDPPPFFGNSPAGPANGHPNNRLLGGLNFVDALTPTSTLSINGGITRWVEGRTPEGSGFLPSTLGFPSSLNIANNFPFIGFGGAPTYVYPLANNANGNGATDAWAREDRTFGIDYSKIAGSHSISAGFTLINVRTDGLNGNQASFNFGANGTGGPDPLAVTSQTGLQFASFLLGVGQGGSGTVPQLTNFSAQRYYDGAYIQDDWKVTPKLTLSAGIRYEIQTAPTERYNQQGWFDYGAINPISNMINPTTGQTVAQMLGRPVYGEEVQAGVDGASRGLFNVQYNNFAPRFALAYSPIQKFVIRSGFAIFYVPDFVFPGGAYNAPGYSANSQWNTTQANGALPASLLSNPLPGGLTQELGAIGPLIDVGNAATVGYSHWRPTPYVEQWSLGLQFQTTKNSLLDLEYIGNHGLKLPTASYNRDAPYPTTVMANQANLTNLVPNPFYGVITSSACNLNAPKVQLSVLLNPYPQYCGVSESQAEVASSWYEALDAKFTQRWSGGLQMLASFTWSKYLDNSAGVQGWTNYASQTVPNPYNLRQDKSYDINDIPLAFTASFVYDLPVGRGRHFGHDMNNVANAIVGGWQVSSIFSAHDGFPLSVETSAPGGSLGVYEGGLVRPNVICNPTPANRAWNNFINPACFTEPVANYSYASLGNAPATEGYFRGPGYVNLDLALHKNWVIGERLRTELRAEAFNIANHVNFFAPGGGSLFWYPGYTANVANLTGSYPARNVQLALKLLW